jgi:hypothetical protein
VTIQSPRVHSKCVRFCFSGWAAVACLMLFSSLAIAQQTLGAMNGTVTDSSGAVVQGATVKVRAPATNLEVQAETKADGSFNIADLPIGTYEVSFTKDGFQTALYPQIALQGNRTMTVNAKLTPGHTFESVTVNATPLLNETDTTTGYVLDSAVIDNTPLGTGSFTQLAILSPGVNADLLNTAGTNAGFGNQSIWANGQRDSSNSFSFNGVNANNIFNGKSSSQLTSGRVAVNVGQGNNAQTGEIQTSTSVYGAIGQALPTPPPEAIQELHVNSAMYDASQGANSGAHIEVMTRSGTNQLHGGAWEYYQTGGWNSNPWFNNAAGFPTPALHRNVFGGMLGGPIKKDKLFFFASYQGQRVSDQLLGNSLIAVPAAFQPDNTTPVGPSLTSDRSAAGLANLVNADFGPTPCGGGSRACTKDDMDPVALKIMQQTAPGGGFLVPNAVTDPTQLHTLQGLFADSKIQGPPALFRADQVITNLDYNFSAKDRLAGKYYYQRDPNTNSFSNSFTLGFPTTLNAGSQVVSVDNTTVLNPNLSWEQRFGFIREVAYAGTKQSLTPSSVGITLPGDNQFPQITIPNVDGPGNTLTIGPSNFANAGLFQNNFGGASNLGWVHGRHTIQTGFNFDYTQLNVINKDSRTARLNFASFAEFMQGHLCSFVNPCGFAASPSEMFSGVSNRHYRSRQAGLYVQDDIRLKHNLSVDLGVRWDWDGPLVEKNGLLANFYPKDYQYNVAADSFGNNGQAIGLVIAGNNKGFGTKGVSNSTLTGRQWGFAPRIGIVYSPSFVKNMVVRAGFGMYYDRGEYFAYFSQPAGGGVSGPFGVTMSEPFVVPNFANGNTATLALPFGTTPLAPPPNNFSQVINLIPNASQIVQNTTTFCSIQNPPQSGCGGLFFAGYNPANKLPYSENWTLDLQWQPLNTWVITLGYVGNHGVHEVIPLPFNQAQIANPNHILLAGGPFPQKYSYGWQVPGVAAEKVQTLVAGFGSGNAALRVPFIGYDPNSTSYQARGISNYNALQVGLNKRMSRGLLVTASYTYSHTLDEQSGLGLFFTGNDPNNLKSAYGNSDFDRTHVFSVSYLYQFPSIAEAAGWAKQIVNGWGLSGVTTLESGQPYSVNDFSGGAASIYWGGGNDFITNPIIPVGGAGSTSKNPILQGTTGIDAHKPVLNVNAFGPPPLLAPGDPNYGVPPCDAATGACDYFETPYASGGRNIFRGPFQNRFDFGVFKSFKLTERFSLRYDAQIFNIFNHPSFDVPSNSVQYVTHFRNPPIFGPLNPSTGESGPCVPLPVGPNTPAGSGAFQCPPALNLGMIQHTIGSPRFIQMALHLTF